MQPSDIGDGVAALEYPLTTDELIERIGDREIDLPAGTETVGEALGPLGSETFQRPEEARFAVLSGLGEAAIGRKGYSDRDPTTAGSPHGHAELSF